MKITALETIRVAERPNLIWLQVHTDQGLVGYLGFRSSGAEMRGNSAFDIALWNLFGKATGQPIVQLLGGFTRRAIRTYNTCAGTEYVKKTTGQVTPITASATARSMTI